MDEDFSQNRDRRNSTLDPIVEEDEDEIMESNSELKRLEDLIEAGEAAEAFFLARSLFTSGEEWAEEWMTKAQSML